jgi:hypothetical protein
MSQSYKILLTHSNMSSAMALRITTLSITILSITINHATHQNNKKATFGIMTLSIRVKMRIEDNITVIVFYEGLHLSTLC